MKRLQLGEGPSRGLLRDREILGHLRITSVSSSSSPRIRLTASCVRALCRVYLITAEAARVKTANRPPFIIAAVTIIECCLFVGPTRWLLIFPQNYSYTDRMFSSNPIRFIKT